MNAGRESIQHCPPVPEGHGRAVTSVGFKPAEFELICEEAKLRGMKPTAFIREMALRACRDRYRSTSAPFLTGNITITYAEGI
jgi:hypothetical protein